MSLPKRLQIRSEHVQKSSKHTSKSMPQVWAQTYLLAQQPANAVSNSSGSSPRMFGQNLGATGLKSLSVFRTGRWPAGHWKFVHLPVMRRAGCTESYFQ